MKKRKRKKNRKKKRRRRPIVNGDPSGRSADRNKEPKERQVIDRVSTETLCRIFASGRPAAVEPCIPVIAQAIRRASPSEVRAGGHVFYIGAGTKWTTSLLLESTVPLDMQEALRGAEDSRSGAGADLKARSFDSRGRLARWDCLFRKNTLRPGRPGKAGGVIVGVLFA
ncbi:hypothetical protein NOR_03226 [Metarhizium rileyi]|uniref:Uncharacterized protein n=1 Tax=Metarhizium rileyi (strain RCEF 4871) TaxID=1649241 RepID=A0A167FLA4_METRR|nr:hypothetical protein NOR_03226 [Metarhizium rileyi RCEF 4871]